MFVSTDNIWLKEPKSWVTDITQHVSRYRHIFVYLGVKKHKWWAMGVWWGVRWAPGTSWAFLLSLMHLIPGNVRKNRPGPWSAWIPLLIWGSAELMRQVQHPAHQSDPSICPHRQHHYGHGHLQQRHHHHHGHQQQRHRHHHHQIHIHHHHHPTIKPINYTQPTSTPLAKNTLLLYYI